MLLFKAVIVDLLAPFSKGALPRNLQAGVSARKRCARFLFFWFESACQFCYQAKPHRQNACRRPAFLREALRILRVRTVLSVLLPSQNHRCNACRRLAFLGEALRTLLVWEVRSASLVSTAPCAHPFSLLAPGCSAARCALRTASGAEAEVVIAAPSTVLESNPLLEHAARQTLVADALSLCVRLPPPALNLPTARSAAHVAGGVPVIDSVALASVWAVALLRQLGQQRQYPGLAVLGVAGVGSAVTQHFSDADVERFQATVTGGTLHDCVAAAGGAAAVSVQ